MARYGIPSDNAFGVSVANIRVLARRLGRNHELAAALWETGWYEARMLTSFVDEPARVTSAQMDRWCRDFDNWAICDTVCFHLFDVSVARYGEAGPGPKGTVMTGTFQLDGQEFMALNGGPHFKFTEAISLFVNCETQEEVDELWEKLSEGGEEGQCGWLKDKYGLSWQIVPSVLGKMLQDKDPEKSQRVMKAMLQMHKIDIERLKQAYDRG